MPVGASGGTVAFQLQAFDFAGNVSTSGPTANLVTLDASPPSWPAGATLAATPTGFHTARLNWTPASDNVAVTGYLVYKNGALLQSLAGTILSLDVASLDPQATYSFHVEAKDQAGNASTGGPSAALHIGVPDPVVLAPPLDQTAPARFADSISFLYSGPEPIQTGVDAGAITATRAALLQGQVFDVDGNAVRDVTVRVHAHPELGSTRTRADGRFDLVANGGGALVLEFTHPSYLTAQRQLKPDWETTLRAPDIVLVQADDAVSEISTNAPVTQVARGSVVEDDDGPRQVTLIVPPDTTAMMVMPDGTQVPLSTMNVRATEYSVGANGRKSLPAELPTSSAYTYAVNFQVDEAVAAGATTVSFSQPVVAYLENFVNIPEGQAVPSGYYDRAAARWVTAPNGRVLAILPSTNQLAAIDADGDGLADPADQLAAIGITDAERATLATLYAPGQSLWRVPIGHFSAWSWDWCNSVDGDAPSFADPPELEDEPEKCPVSVSGSIVDCDDQVLGEVIPVVGTGLGLVYSSARAVSRRVERSVRLHLINGLVPRGLSGILVELAVAGTYQRHEYTPSPDLSVIIPWDGKDGFGRRVPSAVNAFVRVSYRYTINYRETNFFAESSAIPGRTKFPPRLLDNEFIYHFEGKLVLGRYSVTPENSFGGWTLTENHFFDSSAHILHYGDGTREEKSARQAALLAREANPNTPMAMANAPDGTLYFTTNGVIGCPTAIFKKSPSSPTPIRFAGTGDPCFIGPGPFAGDNGPAVSAKFSEITGVAVAPDGAVYIRDTGNSRIRRVAPNGIVTTVAGTGVFGTTGDDGPATSAPIGRGGGIVAADDGSVYITSERSIRKIATDGTIRHVADFPFDPQSPVYSIFPGPSDTLYLTDQLDANSPGHRIYRLGSDGRLDLIAGAGHSSSGGDGGPASLASVNVHGLAVASDGTVFISDATPSGSAGIIRTFRAGGAISRFAGNSDCVVNADARPAPLLLPLCPVAALALGPRDALHVSFFAQVAGVPRSFLEFSTASEVTQSIPSGDGLFLFDLDNFGHHVRTRSTLSGATLLSIDYASNGKPATFDDGQGNVVSISHEPGSATITAPFGQQTRLSYNSDGYLESVVDPLGQTIQLGYEPSRPDLLASFTHPLRGTSTFTYDEAGRLLRDTAASGGWQQFAHEDQGAAHRTVTRTTRSGLTATFERSAVGDGSLVRRVTAPGGVVTTKSSQELATSASITDPTGTVHAAVLQPNPRFGMDAPIPQRVSVTTPGGRKLSAVLTQTVTLTKSDDPLSLASMTVSSSVNAGVPWTRTYIAATKTLTEKTPSGRTLSSIVDEKGRITQFNAPGRLPHTFQYDGRGHLITVRQGARSATFEYDSAGNLAHMTLPDGGDVRASYDALGRPLVVTRPDGRQIQLSYELAGRRVSTIPPGRPAHTSEVNPEARTSEYRPPPLEGVSSNRQWQFDFDNLLLTATSGNGDLITVDRDDGARPIHLNTPRGTFTYEYNQKTGQLASTHTPEAQSEVYTYDGPLVLSIAIAGEVSGNVAFDYDANLRPATEMVNGDAVGFGYDSDNLLTQVGALLLQRDLASGDVTAANLDGMSIEFGRNEFGEADHLTSAFDGAALFTQDVLSRDMTGRVLSRREVIAGESHTNDYTYDALGRLIDVAVDGIPSTHYEYDDNGNRIERDAAESVQGRYDVQDRLMSLGSALYSYTADGALETTVDTATGATTSYAYDVAGNLLAVALPSGDHIDYVVDDAGRRVGRKVNGALTNRWIYGFADGPAAEIGANGQVVARFVYATKSWVPTYMRLGGATYAVVTDHVGSVRLIIDTATGDVAQRLDYDEFGRVLLDTNPGFQPFGFAGGLYDPETGLVRLGARDYDPATGRWTTKDPLLFDGGDTNLYSYCGSDPTNCTDPSGLRDPDLAMSRNPTSWEPPPATGYYLLALLVGVVDPWISAAMIIATAKDENSPALAGGIAGGAAAGFIGDLAAGFASDAADLAGGGCEAAIDSAPSLMEEAKAARDSLAAELAKNRHPPATVVGAFSESTGEVTAGASRGGGLGCAEGVCSEALGNPPDIKFTPAVRPRTGQPVPVCAICEAMFGRGAFPELETIFKSDL